MSKKDYVAIAAVFAEQRELKMDPKRVGMMNILAFSLAAVFAKDNPRFDRARFMQACGVPFPN